MRILIDTNVLIDFFAKREPFIEHSAKIFELCQQEIVEGSIAAHSIVNMSYILRKNFSLDELKKIFLRLCEIFYVEAINWEQIIRSIDNNTFSDFEDCLQMQCALNFKADIIVTRNIGDFKSSIIPAMTPEDFCKLFDTSKADFKTEGEQ